MENTALRGLTMAFNSSALTATGAETVHDSTVAMNFCIRGKVYQKSGTNADQATPTTDYGTGLAFPTLTANKGSVMVWAYNASGTVKCIMGDITDLDSAGNFVVAPEFPLIPSDVCPFAYQVLKAGSTAGTITFGTSNWNATGFTNAIVNISTLPDRPQVS
jgi:hypothetical protein